MPEPSQAKSAQDLSQFEKCQDQLTTIKRQVAALQFPAADKWCSFDIIALSVLMNNLERELASAESKDRPTRLAEALLLMAKCAYFSDPPGLTDADRRAQIKEQQ